MSLPRSLPFPGRCGGSLAGAGLLVAALLAPAAGWAASPDSASGAPVLQHQHQLQDPAPEDPAPEDPAPEDPAPENPAPEDPAPEDPAPGESGGPDEVGTSRRRVVYGIDGWGLITGGGGVAIGARRVHPAFRISAGIGGQLFVLYGSVTGDIGVSPHQDFLLMGVGHVGVILPIPVVKPFVGFRGGGGLHVEQEFGPSPVLTLGPEVGVHFGQIGRSSFGIRIAVELNATISTGHRMGALELLGLVGVLL